MIIASFQTLRVCSAAVFSVLSVLPGCLPGDPERRFLVIPIHDNDYRWFILPLFQSVFKEESPVFSSFRAGRRGNPPGPEKRFFFVARKGKAILESSDFYTAEELTRYRSFWDNEGVGFFEENSDWGFFYTGILPLRDSAGDTVALACADIPIADLHARINNYQALNTLLILAVTALFGAALVTLMRRTVTQPILALEKSARDFAAKSHTIQNYQELKYQRPEITTENEVKSLADAVGKMADDIFRYMDGILSAEKRAKNAELEAESMTVVAYQDALTHVKSKAAYDQMVLELNAEIGRGDARFALVMADLNNLKQMNDTYGHENGNRYIVGACQQLCLVYAHSPVYRIGGDEFVAVLRGSSYEERDILFDRLQNMFITSRKAVDRPPWERYSAAAGMAAYTGAPGETVEDVFRRADERMYADKQGMKAEGLTQE